MASYYHSQFRLSYVDFPPRCAGAGEVICTPKYERFNSLISRANDWLRKNGHLRAKACESIEIKGRMDGIVDTNKSSYFEADHTKRRMRNIYIRALRLWVIPKESHDPPEPQQLGYVNVVPSRNEYGTFDSFGTTIKKFNAHLRQKPLPGRIVGVESQEMKFHDWGVGVDPDESCWVESVKFNLSFLVVIRVFYEHGSHAFEEIEGDEVDTQRSFYVESGRYTTRYLRILRLCFAKPFYNVEDYLPVQPIYLNYVTFEPKMVSSGGIIGIPIFESMAETMKKAMTWLNKTRPDLRIVSAESIPIRMFSGNQYGNHEITYTWNRGEQKEFWLLVIRIFLDGEFDEPPPDMCQEDIVPQSSRDNSNCCNIL